MSSRSPQFVILILPALASRPIDRPKTPLSQSPIDRTSAGMDIGSIQPKPSENPAEPEISTN
jgi:hypothetical protein